MVAASKIAREHNRALLRELIHTHTGALLTDAQLTARCRALLTDSEEIILTTSDGALLSEFLITLLAECIQ